MRGEGWASPVRDAPHPRAKRAKGQNGLRLTFVPRVKKTPPRRSSLRVCGLSCPSRCPIAVPYTTERRQSLPACGAAATIEPSTDNGQKRTHSCAYISATTSHASGCKSICEAGVFNFRQRCRIIAKHICASSTCRFSCNISCNISCNTH